MKHLAAAARGRWGEAGMNVLAAIPAIGIFTKAGQLGYKGYKLGKLGRVIDKVKDIGKAVDKLKDGGKFLLRKADDLLGALKGGRVANKVDDAVKGAKGVTTRSLDVLQWGNQRLFYNGTRQTRAQAIVDEAAKAAGVQLSNLVDDVVFTTGRSPWFSIINGRRTIALSTNTLRKTKAGQLITAVHELTHARHSAKLGHAKYMQLYATQRARIEVLVETRALRTIERYLGGLTTQQVADSMRYINSWLQ